MSKSPKESLKRHMPQMVMLCLSYPGWSTLANIVLSDDMVSKSANDNRPVSKDMIATSHGTCVIHGSGLRDDSGVTPDVFVKGTLTLCTPSKAKAHAA